MNILKDVLYELIAYFILSESQVIILCVYSCILVSEKTIQETTLKSLSKHVTTTVPWNFEHLLLDFYTFIHS